MRFKLLKCSKFTKARLSLLETAHGAIKAPFFMPLATQGVVRNLTTEELISPLGAQILLANTFHLYSRPGMKVIKEAGGLHSFIGWKRPILTDSGGFQIFSLRKGIRGRHHFIQVKEDGVEFVSPFDGSRHFFNPEQVLQIQRDLGVDLAIVLDECVEYPCSQERAVEGAQRTFEWAKKSKEWLLKKKPEMAVFGIIQGSIFQNLRQESARQIISLDFDGYAIGGVSVGEEKKEIYQVIDWVESLLPSEQPRYLMGIGYPEDIVEGVKRGMDMFDCVIPTREGRHGKLFVWRKDKDKDNFKDFYKVINITNAQYKKDFSKVERGCKCILCQTYSRAYLHHLFKIKDGLALRLGALHNLTFYVKLMQRLRSAIQEGEL